MPARSPSEVHVCLTCRRVLDLDEVTGYQHTMQDADADHEAQPVPYSEMFDVLGRCDFCNVDHPDFVLPARDFMVAPGHVNQGDWAACMACADLIGKDQWTALARRVVTLTLQQHPDRQRHEVEIGVGRVYRLLRKNIIGSLRPLHGDRFGQGFKIDGSTTSGGGAT